MKKLHIILVFTITTIFAEVDSLNLFFKQRILQKNTTSKQRFVDGKSNWNFKDIEIMMDLSDEVYEGLTFSYPYYFLTATHELSLAYYSKTWTKKFIGYDVSIKGFRNSKFDTLITDSIISGIQSMDEKNCFFKDSITSGTHSPDIKATFHVNGLLDTFWYKDEMFVNTYDGEKLTFWEAGYWDESENKFDVGETQELLYDAQGRTTEFNERWPNSRFDIVQQYKYSYPSDNEIVIDEFKIDTETGDTLWDEYYFLYDEQGNLSNYRFKDFDSTGQLSILTDSTSYFYNEDQLCTLSYFYRHSQNKWVLISKNEFKYDDQSMLLERVHFSYTNDSWEFGEKDSYVYDSKGNCILHRAINSLDSLWEFQIQYKDGKPSRILMDIDTVGNSINIRNLFEITFEKNKDTPVINTVNNNHMGHLVKQVGNSVFIQGFKDDISVRIYSLHGKELFSTTTATTSSVSLLKLDKMDLANGIYSIVISDGIHSLSGKIRL